MLGYDGLSTHHTDQARASPAGPWRHGAPWSRGAADLTCDTQGCLVQHAIASPLVVEERVAGALVALTDQPSASLLRATEEVAQLGVRPARARRARRVAAPADARRRSAPCARRSARTSSTTRSARSPSFVRTDPDRARELLLEFADFTRYSFRQHGEFTTLAEELRSIERYLLLEQARFGDRLRVTLQVAPEVLGVNIPFLCLQPLVENAVRHGLEANAGGGQHLDRGPRRRPRVRDRDRGRRRRRGPRADPRRARRESGDDSVGLANVDERLRATFGDEYGLVVETAPGAGTKVVVRVPKFAPGVYDMNPGLRVLVIDDERPALDELAFLLEQDERVGRGARDRLPHRGAAAAAAARGRRGLPRHPDARADRHRARAGAVPLQDAAGGGLRHGPRPARRRRLRPQRGRLRAQAGARGPPRRGRTTGARRDPHRAGRGAGARRARGRHPLRAGLARSATSRRRATTRDCTPATTATSCASRSSQLEQEWAEAGFVRIHRSLLIATAFVDEVHVDGGRCSVVIGDQRAPGQPPAHARAARRARAQRQTGATTGREDPGP